MNGKSRHLLITLALSALGAGLLLLLTRTSATDVQAEQGIEQPAEARVEPVSAQAMYDLRPLFVDGYDGTYPSSYKIPRAITYTAGSAPYTWGRVLTSTTEFTDTLWCVRGEMGATLDPDTGFYTDSVTTTVTYGPFSLRDAITVELEFSHWVSMSVGEAFEWGVSTDGSTYTYNDVSTTSAGDWETTVLSSEDLSELAGLLDQDAVYLAFRFRSDNDNLVDRGVFWTTSRFGQRTTRERSFPSSFEIGSRNTPIQRTLSRPTSPRRGRTAASATQPQWTKNLPMDTCRMATGPTFTLSASATTMTTSF